MYFTLERASVLLPERASVPYPERASVPYPERDLGVFSPSRDLGVSPPARDQGDIPPARDQGDIPQHGFSRFDKRPLETVGICQLLRVWDTLRDLETP